MVSYYAIPNLKVTVDGTDYINDQTLSVSLTGIENGFDVATVAFSDAKTVNRSNITSDAAIEVYTKDASSGSWGNPVLNGVIRYVTEKVDMQGEQLIAKIDGSGFGFAETLCAQEYGSQSSLPTMDTLKEIVTDLVSNWVNTMFNGVPNSGYNYNIASVDDITGTIRYLYFPYKPASRSLTDICNLSQAIKGLNAGPHWIITPDSKLLVTTVGSHSTAAANAGWTTYYGGSQANATLTQGIDFLPPFSFENQNTQANYILYHSNWLWPGSGDLCENTPIANWHSWATNFDLAYVGSGAKVGTNYISATWNAPTVLGTFSYGYPASPLHLDLTKAGGKYNIPTFGFWCARNSTFTVGTNDPLVISFHSPFIGYDQFFEIGVYLDKLLTDTAWHYISFPIGTYWYLPDANPVYSPIAGTASADWSDILYVTFECNFRPQNSVFLLDGVHFAGWVLRGASNSTKILNAPPTGDGRVKMRIINDQFGKDDTLSAIDDSGTVAQLAYSELLRAQTNPIIGTLETPYLPGLLAGQLVHVHARPDSSNVFQIDRDFRVTQYTHSLSAKNWSTNLTATSDLINSQTRTAYESMNETFKAIRPEYQDKATTGIKMRDIDITQLILGHDYPS
jgi:hypothetical protein